MPSELPVKGVVPVSEMRAETDEETALLRVMSEVARTFLSSFSWCESIKEFYFGDGIGGIFGVFFAHIVPSRPGVDEFLWVIVGDIPPAYLVIDECRTPKQAMAGYIEEMRKWVTAARVGKMSPDIIPVNAPASPEAAKELESRLDTVEHEIMPRWFVE